MAKKILGLTPVEALLLAVAGYFGYTYIKSSANKLKTDQKRTAIVDLVTKSDNPEALKVVYQFTPSEIDTVYDLVVLNKKPQPGTAYYNQVQAIAAKYNIFT